MAYLEEIGECGDVGCNKPARYELYNKDDVLVGRHCKDCGNRRLGLLRIIEQREEPDVG
jgi:hypothetical protein